MTRSTGIGHLYEDDYFSWTQQQAAHLRGGRLAEVDTENVAEEIDSLGKSQLAALTSSYRLIAMHLLKMLARPERMSLSWTKTISRERGNLELLLGDDPGLRPRRPERFAKAYAIARRDVAVETQIDVVRFPVEPPFDVDQAEDHEFWPDATKNVRKTVRKPTAGHARKPDRSRK